MWRSGGEEEEEKEGEGMDRERVIAADIAHAEAHVMWIRQGAGFVGVGSPFFYGNQFRFIIKIIYYCKSVVV